jgi:hypothetical protein
MKRANPIEKSKERESNKLAHRVLRTGSIESNLKEFEAIKKEGPTSVCSCCGGLWFRTSTRAVTANQCDKDLAKKIFYLMSEDTSYKLCETCFRDYRRNQVPRLALANGIDFPEVPSVLKDLTTLEERLCALRLPFMQIRSLGVDGQCGIRGNVVHIENELDMTVSVLPRTEDLSAVIPVGLVRHLDHQRPYLFQEIRPAKVYQAAKYLVTTPIYREEGAVLSENWLREPSTVASSARENEVDDKFFEQEEVNPGSKETLIMQYSCEGIKIAPGQGKRPLSLLMDLNAEAAAYPSIYGGNPRFLPSNMTPLDLWKSETRRYDRRFVVYLLNCTSRTLSKPMGDSILGVLSLIRFFMRTSCPKTFKSAAPLPCVCERRREKNQLPESFLIQKG